MVCNKRDIEKSTEMSEIRKMLESELNKLRSTQTSALDKHDDEEEYKEQVYLGVDGVDFNFDQIPNQVSFIETSFVTSVDKLPVLVGTSDLLSWVMDQIDE
ncbi:Signal recognition particle receptor subunit beta [Smittium mucronatum]|uniref:Signal recognition particle receptor subunit beta n=1 Tax=Smittium mucronatum TaxID=133383 RepID=A0A1R0H6W6_9FUNG|nr:Signal recognition particle receptor subunit beta [Smittium mucronatum]